MDLRTHLYGYLCISEATSLEFPRFIPPACHVASMSLKPLDPSDGASCFSFVLRRETTPDANHSPFLLLQIALGALATQDLVRSGPHLLSTWLKCSRTQRVALLRTTLVLQIILFSFVSKGETDGVFVFVARRRF
jgi:hypothetical protein